MNIITENLPIIAINFAERFKVCKHPYKFLSLSCLSPQALDLCGELIDGIQYMSTMGMIMIKIIG